jgi:hypothetical protein
MYSSANVIEPASSLFKRNKLNGKDPKGQLAEVIELTNEYGYTPTPLSPPRRTLAGHDRKRVSFVTLDSIDLSSERQHTACEEKVP